MSDFWGDRAGASLRNRLQGVRPDAPTHGEIVESCTDLLRSGCDPEPGARKTSECPECGYEEVVGREDMGPDIPGFEETVQDVADMFSGDLSGEEFRECVEDAVAEALQSVENDDMTAEVHVTLQEFEDDAPDGYSCGFCGGDHVGAECDRNPSNEES